jgi:hypothetical protein
MGLSDMKASKQKKTDKARKTWVGFKPRKEATKKERLERARKKYKEVLWR